MNGKVKAFYEAVSSDEALQAGLQEAMERVALEDVSEEEARAAIAEAVASFAAAHGFDLTACDILAADDAADGELVDEELMAVAGGQQLSGCFCVIIGIVKSCGCFIGGNGKDDGMECAGGSGCVMAGDGRV